MGDRTAGELQDATHGPHAHVAGDHQLPRLRRRLGPGHARRQDDGGGWPEKFKGDLLGVNPQGSFLAIVEEACAAAKAFEDLDQTVHCSFGDYPARHYFWQINQFRALRAHDIAREIGVDPDLPPALVQGLWEELAPHAEEWRTIGVLPAAVPVPDDAPLLHRLLGLTGRQPG